MYPKKLTKQDKIMVIAPSFSGNLMSEENEKIAINRLKKLWLNVVFSQNYKKIDNFNSSSVEDRINDLHKAFENKDIKAIFTCIWWYNTNQLLKHIDYNLIKNNPKILIWYSDITALLLSIYTKTGLITYHWPFFSTFAMKYGFDYIEEYFYKCLFTDEPFEVKYSTSWSDDAWYIDQEKRQFIKNKWPWIINKWEWKWKILWWNLNTLNLLKGTEFFPDITDSIFFVEDDKEENIWTFDRQLQSLAHSYNFSKVQWVLIWRFETWSKITEPNLKNIISTKKELKNKFVVWNLDFWHTFPFFTFPIWGQAIVKADNKKVYLKIVKH